jgi:hypothetical protein
MSQAKVHSLCGRRWGRSGIVAIFTYTHTFFLLYSPKYLMVLQYILIMTYLILVIEIHMLNEMEI